MGEITDPVVTLERSDGVATITLERPGSLNAMSMQLMDELRTALEDVADDASVRCVVLRGAGRAFSAGGDISDIGARQKMTEQAASAGALFETFHRRMAKDTRSAELLRTMPKPTVAVVQGWAVGGGMSLALAADFRVIARSARMRPGFLPNALSGDFGIGRLLVESVGASRARDILLLDRTIDSAFADALGLANLVVDDAELERESAVFVARLAHGPSIAYGRAKDNLNSAARLEFGEYLLVEAANQRVSASTADARESWRAASEGRTPEFTGQ